MIDNFSIILFGALCVYVAYKAIILDKTVPWFGTPKKADEQTRKQKQTIKRT